jgi:hypothetical protein
MNSELCAPAAPQRWVSSKLQFGLGNRLFQLAAAHKLAEQWSVPLVFAMPYCRPSEHGDFDTIFKLFPDIPKLWKAEPLLAIDQDAVFQVAPLPTVAPADRTLLHGMWQDAKCVSDTFRPSWSGVEDKEHLLARWSLKTDEQRTKTAFLHVRLGDYKILPHHQVNLLAYFATAMASFPEDTRFLIFSDSLEEAQQLPVFTANDRCVFVQEDNELNTLYLMSLCSAGAITANSTFSWWGAYFGRQNTNASLYRAYMPSPWMAKCSEPTEPIYPSWATVIGGKN